MVRVSGQIQGLPASIAGGFVLVPISALMAAWRACRARPLGVGDFRAYLACREMVARRSGMEGGRTPAYGAVELAGLLGITPRRAGAALARLEAAGLLEWSGSALGFAALADGPDGPELADTIGRGHGSLAIPRRILRHLAAGARPALIATALGVLLRCLTRRRSGFDGRGRVKAAWIARAFGVDLRRVKAARRELVELGWITPEPADQWAMNRWGRAYRIDLGWSSTPSTPSPAGPGSTPPAPPDAPPLPPPAPPAGPGLPPPDSDPEPLREIRDQEPGRAGPAGVQLSGIGHRTRTPPGTGPLPPPRLDDVRPEDLRDTARLLELHGQAVARGAVTSSEADRLRFVAAAEHALAIGRANPPGLFAYLIRGRLWRYSTASDEGRANARIKARHTHHSPCPSGGGRRWGGPATSGGPSDAEIVRAVRAAAIRAGVFRDPWPEFERLNPGWTRERWDRAVG